MRTARVIKKTVLYIFSLVLIFPASPHIFRYLINIKEPSFICPLSYEDEIPIRSDAYGKGYFGARRSGGKRRHKGLDIAGDIGDSIYASKSGIVEVGNVPKGLGNYVKIQHIDGYNTLYGHMSSFCVEKDLWVWQGQKIGEVGRTGNADNPRIKPHVHFEIRKGKKAYNPLAFLAKDK
ncbi:MAG: M23 family metallopeptidase [Candidatus Omnitrophota bacterium]